MKVIAYNYQTLLVTLIVMVLNCGCGDNCGRIKKEGKEGKIVGWIPPVDTKLTN